MSRSHLLCLFALAAGAWLIVPSAAQSALRPAALLRDYQFRNLGPASAGGRITDVVGYNRDPRIALVAAAGGGVWKTSNMGTTWTPISDQYGDGSIGAVAMFQGNPRILWVGTGEANNRNDVGWGDGVYKSSDGGATFTDTGLRDTFQIARIVTHPTDPNLVYVAAIGDLWGSSGERGLFKTSDGGATWQHLTKGLPDDGKTGAIDLVMDPSDPDVLYAAFYQRLRRPWRFDSGGPNGGIFKTTDGGAHWAKLTRGLPTGETGRIGLDVSLSHPTVVMAIVEAPGDLTGVYRSEDSGATWTHVNHYNNRPFYYSQIRVDPFNDQTVYVLTTSFQESRDGGKTFTRMGPPYGSNYDYHAMWLDPHRPGRFYVGGDKGLWLSQDAGATMHFYDNLPVEQFYKVATDDRTPYSIYGGLQDNGTYATMSFTRDILGVRNDATWKVHWDDGQYIVVDPANWRRIYSEGTEGTFRVVDPIGHTDTARRATPLTITNFQAATGIAPGAPGAAKTIRFNWTTPFILSPYNPRRLYYGTNYLLTSTDAGRHWQIISPDLSRHDPAKNQIGTGGITPDTTGAEGYATIYTISASPLVKGLIWVGTDDGNIWVTRDGGGHWTRIDPNIHGVPPDLWVTRIAASALNPETAYVAFDGHRSDNFDPWLFKTTDGGKTWTNLSGGLPAHNPLYCIIEDDKNPNLLFAGTEDGLEVSLDAGRSWTSMAANGMPRVAVYDVVIQPHQRDLIVGTHGRGIWVLDDLSALEQWQPALAEATAHLFTQRPNTLWVDGSRTGQTGSDVWAGGNPPDVAPPRLQIRDRQHIQDTPVITFALGPRASGMATLAITDPAGQTRTIEIPARPGITRYVWDGRMVAFARSRGAGRASGAGRGAAARGGRSFGPPAPLQPGVYQLQLKAGGATATGTLTLVPDPIEAKTNP